MKRHWGVVRYTTVKGEQRVYDYSAPTVLTKALKSGVTLRPSKYCGFWEAPDGRKFRQVTVETLLRRGVAEYDGVELKALK